VIGRVFETQERKKERKNWRSTKPVILKYPPLLPLWSTSFPVEDHLVGTPTLNHNGRVTGRTVAKPTIGARQHRLCLSSCSPLPAPCSAKTSYPAPHPHNTTPLHATTPPSHLPLYSHPPKPTPSNTSFFCANIDPRFCVRFFVKGAHSMGPPTPTRLGKVYKGALVVPLSSPHQRAFVCGACTGTTQVGIPLVSLFDPLFKRSRLHCFDICEQIELQAKLPNYFLGSNKSNINQI